MSNDTSKLVADFEAEEQRERERLPAAKQALLKALSRTRAARVTIEYDGEGDTGQIGDIVGRSAAGNPVKLTGQVSLDLDGQPADYPTLEEAIEAFAWALLRAYHGGFEDNDGGFGKIVIDVSGNAVRIEHNWRICSSEYTEAEI